MSFKSNGYADREKYNEYRRRYAKSTGAGQYKRKKFTEDEDIMILAHSIPDRELGKKLERSVMSIAKRRYVLKRGKKYE